MLRQPGKPNAVKRANLNDFEQVGRQCLRLVDPLAIPILADAQQVDAVKTDRIDHIALDPSLVIASLGRQAERDLDRSMKRHNRIWRGQTERDDFTQAWPGLDTRG